MKHETTIVVGFFVLVFLVLMFLGLATNLKKKFPPAPYGPGLECAWVCVNDPIVTPTTDIKSLKEQQ